MSDFIARFGNISPTNYPNFDGKEIVTTTIFPPDISVDEAFITVTDPSGAWANNSSANPTWVFSTNTDLATRLAAHYNCPVSAE